MGSPSPPRPGSALRTLAEGLAAGDVVVTATEAAVALLGSAPPARGAPERVPALAAAVSSLPPRPRSSPARRIAIDAAGLALFRDCPRRFRLRRVLGIEEPAGASQLDLFAAGDEPEPIVDLPPPVADDPALDLHLRSRAPHRALARWPRAAFGRPTDRSALEARLVAAGLPPGDAETARLARSLAAFLEGPYARAVREEGASPIWDETFVVDVDAGVTAGTGSEERRLLLRGTLDLRVDRPDDRVDLIAVSEARARPVAGAHELSLRAAALAVQRAHPEAAVRAGVLFLGAGVEIGWLRGGSPDGALTAGDHVRFEAEAGALAQQVAEATHEDRFDGIARARCQRLGCGFLPACHGAQGTRP